jgi:NAD(P)-dependent dehydrogenase (short-subunit alcohol dehydrogenase family)
MMRSLRQTMPKSSMRVNIIAPWFINTRIIADPVVDLLVSRGIEFADKADAAAAVMHLASDQSINGESLE